MANNFIKFVRGTQAEYNALKPTTDTSGDPKRDADTVYICTDEQRLFIGDNEYSRPVTIGSDMPGSGTAASYPLNSLYYDGEHGDLYYTDGTYWVNIYSLADLSSRFIGAQVDRTANTVLAAPNGSNGPASFRQLVADDITGPLMYIASYGTSTYAEVSEAYQENRVIYCRASSNKTNPATGDKLRLAFLAYVNNQANPTSFEFQYYRSANKHTADEQGDQVFVYTLKNTGSNNGWSFLVRDASTKIIAGTSLNSTYVEGANSTITLNHDDGDGSLHVPATGTINDGKFLKAGSTAGSINWASLTPADSGITITSSSVSYGNTTFEKYIHPTEAGYKHIPSGGATNQYLKYSSSGTAEWATISTSEISGYSSGVTSVSWDATNGLQQTVDNATTSTIVSPSSLISDLGLSTAMHFRGIATVAITEGSRTNPTISTYSFGTNGANALAGDVIIDSASQYEYVWTANGTSGTWEKLGSSETYSLSTHTHGNITNDGKIGNSSDWILASGDGLVVFDSSNSNKLEKSAITFDASTTTQALTKAGSWQSFSYVNLNGSNNTTPSFYAPTGAGTSGQYLKSGGSGTAPTWETFSAATVGLGNVTNDAQVTNVAWDSTNKKITKTIGANTTDVATQANLQSAIFVVSSTAPSDHSVIWLKPVE